MRCCEKNEGVSKTYVPKRMLPFFFKKKNRGRKLASKIVHTYMYKPGHLAVIGRAISICMFLDIPAWDRDSMHACTLGPNLRFLGCLGVGNPSVQVRQEVRCLDTLICCYRRGAPPTIGSWGFLVDGLNGIASLNAAGHPDHPCYQHHPTR